MALVGELCPGVDVCIWAGSWSSSVRSPGERGDEGRHSLPGLLNLEEGQAEAQKPPEAVSPAVAEGQLPSSRAGARRLLMCV